MKWVNVAGKDRKIIQEKNPELFDEVVRILLEHDLMRIDYEVNPDEYEPEAGTIIPRLPDCSNDKEARKVIHEEFVRWFDNDLAGGEEEYTALAVDIADAVVRPDGNDDDVDQVEGEADL